MKTRRGSFTVKLGHRLWLMTGVGGLVGKDKRKRVRDAREHVITFGS